MNSRRFTASASRASDRKDSTPRWCRTSAALRDYESAYVGSGSFTSLWLLRSTVRMSASHPKATESLRSSEMTLSADTVAKVAAAPLWNSNLKQSNRDVRTLESGGLCEVGGHWFRSVGVERDLT